MQISCPNCGADIEYKDYQQGECPECHCQFAAETVSDEAATAGDSDSSGAPSDAPAPAAETSAATSPAQKRKQYRWGRRYISWSRFVAWMMIIVCLTATALMLWNGLAAAWDARRENLQKAMDEEAKVDGEALLKQQGAITDNFNNLTALLSDNNVKGAFLKLPDAMMFKTYAFPAAYETLADIEQAQAEVKSVARDVATLKENMASALAACLQAMQRQNQQTHLSTTVKGSSNTTQQSLLISPGVKRQFYEANAEAPKRRSLNSLADLADEVSHDIDASSKTRMEMGTLILRLEYIINHLISKEPRTATRNVVDNSQRETTVSRRSGGRDFAEELAELAMAPAIATSDWRIDMMLAALQTELNIDREHFVTAERLRRDAGRRFWRRMLLYVTWAAGLLFSGLASAFLVLVFADYLQAHFDVADNSEKTLEKLEK